MPNVTLNPSKTEKFFLKTATDPVDPGWVELRALPYGLKLVRRDKMSRMSMKAQNKRGSDAGEITLESFNEWAVQFDFTNCIVDHNLTDANGAKLDFSNKMIFRSLDPRVGSEIEKYINSLNEDDEGDMEDFISASNTSLMIDSTTSSNAVDLSNETRQETPSEMHSVDPSSES